MATKSSCRFVLSADRFRKRRWYASRPHVDGRRLLNAFLYLSGMVRDALTFPRTCLRESSANFKYTAKHDVSSGFDDTVPFGLRPRLLLFLEGFLAMLVLR